MWIKIYVPERSLEYLKKYLSERDATEETPVYSTRDVSLPNQVEISIPYDDFVWLEDSRIKS